MGNYLVGTTLSRRPVESTGLAHLWRGALVQTPLHERTKDPRERKIADPCNKPVIISATETLTSDRLYAAINTPLG